MPLPDPKPEIYSEDDCAICHEPLVIPSDDANPLNPSYVIDDVELTCGHHFHQSCIMEYALSSPNARECCALCRSNVLDEDGNFFVSVKTENGFAGWIDLGDEIDREAFMKENPNIARAQDFLSIMSQQEFVEAEKYLKGEDESGGSKLSPDVLYQTGGQTAMHMAAYNDDVEGVRLLLRYGADKHIKDEDGQTALDCAKDADAKGVIALLKE